MANPAITTATLVGATPEAFPQPTPNATASVVNGVLLGALAPNGAAFHGVYHDPIGPYALALGVEQVVPFALSQPTTGVVQLELVVRDARAATDGSGAPLGAYAYSAIAKRYSSGDVVLEAHWRDDTDARAGQLYVPFSGVPTLLGYTVDASGFTVRVGNSSGWSDPRTVPASSVGTRFDPAGVTLLHGLASDGYGSDSLSVGPLNGNVGAAPTLAQSAPTVGDATQTTQPLTWAAPQYATGAVTYAVQVARAPTPGTAPASGTEQTAVSGLTVRAATVSGLTPRTRYGFRIVASDAGTGTTATSDWAYGLTADTPTSISILLAAGQGAGLTLTALNADGTPAAGIALAVTASDPLATVTPASGVTAADGTLVVVLVPRSGRSFLLVTASGTIQGVATVLTLTVDALRSDGRDKRRLVAAGKA